MTDRTHDLTDEAIARFLRARSADPDIGLVDEIVRTAEVTPQVRPWFGLGPIFLPRRTLLIIVSALLLAAMGAIGVGSRLLQADPLVITFGGTWISTTDADGGTQTMNVEVSDGGLVEITVYDTIASVCSLTPSTMTGSGSIEDAARIVIPEPVYTCDDGSRAVALSGGPLEDLLRNWTMTHDPESGVLTDNTGGVWHREGAAVPSPDSSAAPTVSDQMWPQTSLDEVREAQGLADAGDPNYAWQVDPALVDDAAPWGAEILERFLREGLGWEDFHELGGFAYGDAGGLYAELVFIRCAPDQTNLLYPDDPKGRGCAPTIDDLRYETVMITIEQPARRDPSGIWVVTEWVILQPGEPSSLFDHLYPDFTQRQVEQVAPVSDAEATAHLEAFLAARADGEGAESYVLRERETSPFKHKEVPLLYADTDGARYERFEIERLQVGEWPSGWIEFRTRLFSEDGTVVEQSFHVVRNDGLLGLVYGHSSAPLSTTEDGQSVAVLYSALGGDLTFAAAPPWDDPFFSDGPETSLGRIENGSASQFTQLAVVADPLTAAGCEVGPAPADAESLVSSIAANPDLEATAPVAVSVGGIDALRMDIVAPGQPGTGDCVPMVLEHLSLSGEARMRVYVLDLPEGMSARLLAIGIIAHESMFDDVLEAATPVLESFEFQTP